MRACVCVCVCVYVCVISLLSIKQSYASPLFQASLVTYFEINQSVIQLLVLINVMSYAIVGLLTGWT